MISHRVLPLFLWIATSTFACSKAQPNDPAASTTPESGPQKNIEATAEPPPKPPVRTYKDIHRDALVLDAHCDTLLRVIDQDADMTVRADEGHVDFPRLKEGGVDAMVFAVWVDRGYWPDRAKERGDAMIDAFETSVKKSPHLVGHALTAADARKLAAKGKIAAFLGIEGGHAIENDISNLAHFYNRGVRYMTLTWWYNTGWADGSGDKPRFNGLSKKGEQVVREMNRLGMVVDVSHASEDTFWDVLEVTDSPVIASHSNTRFLMDHHRNLSDDMLRALAKNGGVVGINYVAGFLDEEFGDKAKRLRRDLKDRFDEIDKRHGKGKKAARKARWELFNEEARKLDPVGISKVLDHIDHAVNIAGIDHVGLGSDFDGFGVGPKEMTDCTRVPLITRGLVERGYSETDISKILGGNFLRVFEKVIK